MDLDGVYRPPRLGDQVFERDPDNPDSFAWLGTSGWHDYITGYREAAELLVTEIESDDGVRSTLADRLVYPAVFLCRQYLELQMKDFIQNAGPVVGLDDGFEATHDLVRLWATCRQIHESFWPGRRQDELDAIDDQIGQLDRVDSGSFAFRYATNRDGSKSLPHDLDSFSVGQFAKRVDAICTFIDGADTGIYEENNMRVEMRAEPEADARSEYAEYYDED